VLPISYTKVSLSNSHTLRYYCLRCVFPSLVEICPLRAKWRCRTLFPPPEPASFFVQIAPRRLIHRWEPFRYMRVLTAHRALDAGRALFNPLPEPQRSSAQRCPPPLSLSFGRGLQRYQLPSCESFAGASSRCSWTRCALRPGRPPVRAFSLSDCHGAWAD
jgi:hypothetical protein